MNDDDNAPMITLNNTLIDTALITQDFVCNLTACKGYCCVEGDYGAPMEATEVETITDHLEAIKPYLPEANRKKLEQEGFWEKDTDGDLVTKCMDEQATECIFARQEANGVYKCTIEQAWEDGRQPFQKPVSCHLYPVRLEDRGAMTELRYDKAEMCDPACTLGESLQVPIYQFVKAALIRKFGEEWYQNLDAVAQGLIKRS